MAEGTAALLIDWAGDPIYETPCAGTAGVLVNWSGDPLAKTSAAGTAAVVMSWAAEPIRFIADGTQNVLDINFIGQIIITGGGVELTAPYDSKSEVETLKRRGTVTETIDTGSYLYDAGFWYGDQEMNVSIEGASRSQVDTARTLLQAGTVAVSLWDGTYSAWVELVEIKGGNVNIKMRVLNKSTITGIQS